MSNHAHIEIGRKLWRAVSIGDADAIRAVLSPDVQWHNRAIGVFPRTVHGPEEVIDMLARAGELVDSLTSKLVDLYANDRGLVLHYRLQAEHGTTSLETDVFLLMKIHEGRIFEVTTVPHDGAALERFWSLH